MELENYSLSLKGRTLLTAVSVDFEPGVVNHILGKNGTGKSQFVKDLLFQKGRQLKGLASPEISVISSFTNLPGDLPVAVLYQTLIHRFGQPIFEEVAKCLNLANIDDKLLIKKLSDGQKQKLKFLSFFLAPSTVMILDEVTTALDRTTVLEIYSFLKQYVLTHPTCYILNITHELTDLSELPGHYYLLADQTIKRLADKQKLIERYVQL